MPKVVDNYVLQRKIGSGQFGDVFKGYNRFNNGDIAVKVIQRDKLKGKFTQLLENQIRVLKTCNNQNIIKLYDIKKTANNFYLIMQYCNQGDLFQYLKKKKQLSQQEAVQFLIQILNAFKTLVKNKIMHRDFKLANILKHDGQIKIADFGFAKLFSYQNMETQTMLGSPLNMAPQVLNGSPYNSKADIWSIGTVFFELIFGRPPYLANSMVDLIKKIMQRPLEIPKRIKISNITQNILRKMLVVDPKKRINWQDLFNDPINFYLEDKVKKQLQFSLQGDDIVKNMSLFYIKNNMVIEHPKEIEKKEELNKFTRDVAMGKTKQKGYSGEIMKRNYFRKQQKLINTKRDKINKQVIDDDIITNQQTIRELKIKTFKRNSNILLHYRNNYVFLASVAEQSMKNIFLRNSQKVGYLLLRKLLQLLQFLRSNASNKINFAKMELWDQFIQTHQFQQVYNYIVKQYEVFKVFYDYIQKQVQTNIRIQLNYQIIDLMKMPLQHPFQQILKKYILQYVKQFITYLLFECKLNNQLKKTQWIHCNRMLDSLQMQKIFKYQNQNGNPFNFRHYYNMSNRLNIQQLQKTAQYKYSLLA